MADSAKFWDRIAVRYSKQPIADQASYQQKLKITQEYFTPEMEVVEIGCGTGSTAILHSPHVKHILATDISAKMIEIAKTKAAAENIQNVEFEQKSIEELSLDEGTIDVVLAMSILHLVADRQAVIEQIYRLLKPGGIFISSTICIGGSKAIFKWIAPVFKWISFLPTVHVFNEEALVQSLTAAGFSLEHQWRPGLDKATFLVVKKP